MRTIVVGGGIAGLYVAEQLAKRGDHVTLLEKDSRLGGRVLTSKLGFEIGAGRIATNHKLVLALIKRFGLKTYRLSEGSRWKGLGDALSQPNDFEKVWTPLVKLFESLTPAKHTLRELADRTIGPALTADILSHYGYRAETEVLRADLAIKSFLGEMGEKAKFVGVVGGLSGLIKAMAEACKAAGVAIQLDTDITAVHAGKVTAGDGTAWTADRIVLALPVSALRKLPIMRKVKLLKHLKMEPLTRIYAKMALPWCMKERLVTDSPLRFIIPIIPELGLVMISYTDAQDTKHFRGLTGASLVGALQLELVRLFPEEGLPVILWAHAYEWTDACTYWLPGSYDPVAESRLALEPIPGTKIHLCNESFSLRQAWMEGALEHATRLLAHLKP